MEGPRAPQIQELSRLINFLDSELRPQAGWSVAEEYPTALSEGNLHNIRFIEEDGEILSHAVVRPLIVKTPRIAWKVSAIGSVLTHPKYRNKGLSRKVIQECLDLSEQQDCDIAILWSNLFEFYSAMGFELAGEEINFRVDKLIPTPPREDLKFLEGNQIDPNAWLRIFNQHSINTLRTYDDVRRLLKIPNSQVITAWNSSGQLAGYLVEGKGADLQDHVHEWGGDVETITNLLNERLKQKQQALRIIVGPHSQQLIDTLSSCGFERHQGYLGLIKILNPTKFAAKIRRTLTATMNSDTATCSLHFDAQDNVFILSCKNESLELTESQLTKLVFGPVKDLGANTSGFLQRNNLQVPLPLWLWGWDSI
ncbi:MAG: GNAT family N-acetyltransferase [Bdellovibrionales bacterium CG10_big_fil_rev_8_21_14_0_10_45_34]|nr:MAG: GNAT family N-acetyltransferase [Bdellovibrionales bacterium CG10_big_fil_rev_8_21_14_0_10_45_34]